MFVKDLYFSSVFFSSPIVQPSLLLEVVGIHSHRTRAPRPLAPGRFSFRHYHHRRPVLAVISIFIIIIITIIATLVTALLSLIALWVFLLSIIRHPALGAITLFTYHGEFVLAHSSSCLRVSFFAHPADIFSLFFKYSTRTEKKT